MPGRSPEDARPVAWALPFARPVDALDERVLDAVAGTLAQGLLDALLATHGDRVAAGGESLVEFLEAWAQGPASSRPALDVAFGRVGPPIDGTEVRIAADGEVLVRGPGVMRGYHGLPDETGEVLDAEGWFATGDVGEVDDRGLSGSAAKRDC